MKNAESIVAVNTRTFTNKEISSVFMPKNKERLAKQHA